MAARRKSRSKRALALELNNLLADIALQAIRAEVPVRRFGRLRPGIRKLVTSKHVTIYSIYYWTRFLNDGRGEVRSTPGGPPLVYFADPRKDPRIRDDYPRQKKGIERLNLSKQRFRQMRRLGQLIVTRAVGPAAAERFLERGLRRARKEIPQKAMERLVSDVRRNIRRQRDKITIGL